MAMADQVDFGAGIHRGREAPENAVYDAVNCLIDDEGQLYRRGGTEAYVAASATQPSTIAAPLFPAGESVVWQADDVANTLYASIDGAAQTTVTLGGSFTVLDAGQTFPRFRDGVILFGNHTGPQQVRFAFYAGSKKAASYGPVGINTFTQGSTIVTNSGSSAFLANVDAGMIVREDATATIFAVVKSVDSNTQLTLTEPWPGASGAEANYVIDPVYVEAANPSQGVASFVATGARRVLYAVGKRLYFSGTDVLPAADDSYHQFPSELIAAASFEDVVLVLTRGGTFRIDNFLLDPIDDAGNIQHVIRRVNALVPWGRLGIAQWEQGFVVPCRDDIYWMGGDGETQSLTGTDESPKLRALWRQYAAGAGSLGTAAVHDGSLLLPVLDASGDPVTTLVCRLDRGAAWTRWTGEAAGRGFAVSEETPPKLYGANAEIRDITPAWTPTSANATEADGTTHALDIITRDLPTPGRAQGSTTQRLRVRYEASMSGTPTFTVSWARGEEGASFTSVTAVKGGGTSDGLDAAVYPVGKKAPAIRFRLQSSSALSTFKLRAVQAEYREHG
jgi:hypothetical protein